jgi:hypothetical protein
MLNQTHPSSLPSSHAYKNERTCLGEIGRVAGGALGHVPLRHAIYTTYGPPCRARLSVWRKNNSRLGEMGRGAGDAKVHACTYILWAAKQGLFSAWLKTTWAVDSVDPITDGHDTGSAAQSVELSSPLTPASHQLPLPPALPTLSNPQSDPDLAGAPVSSAPPPWPRPPRRARSFARLQLITQQVTFRSQRESPDLDAIEQKSNLGSPHRRAASPARTKISPSPVETSARILFVSLEISCSPTALMA